MDLAPMMRWLWFLLAMPAMAQTTLVVGKLQTYNPLAAPNALGNYVEFQLTNCGNNTPTVSGSAVLLSKPIDFYPDSTGALTASANGGSPPTLYGNDVINCGGAFTSRYSVRYFVGGVPQGPAKFYQVLSTVQFNLTTAIPIGLQPPLNPPYPNLTTCAPGSYTNGLNPDLSVKCLNLPSGASNAVVTNPTATQEIAGQLLQLDGPFIAQSVNGTVNAMQYASLNAAVAACPLAGGCSVDINSPIVLNANLSLPSTTTLRFKQPGLINLGGHTLTTGPIEAAPVPIFTNGTVIFGRQVNEPPVEWFGAVGDWNGTTGTDNTGSLQACLNALSSGQCKLSAKAYKTTAPLTITKSQVGIIGSMPGFPNASFYPAPSPSEIIIASPSADVLDVVGTSTSNTISENLFTNFTLARSVAPVLGAAGIKLFFSYGARISGVTSEDSEVDFYLHAVGSAGVGYFENCAALWGFNGVTETSGTLAGFQIDSLDGTPSPSLRIRNSLAVANTTLTGTTTYGLLANGAAMQDLHVDHFETATVNYGEYLQSSGGPSTDIHIINSINDNCLTTCIFVQGVTVGSVEVSGGWDFRQSSTLPVIDIRTSSHVDITNLQIYYPTGTGVGLSADTSGSLRISHNDFIAGSASAISFSSVTASTITGNVMNGITATSIINFVNSSANVLSSNTINGTATNGIALDASSNGTGGLETNQIGLGSLGTITNLITNLGVNPTTFCCGSQTGLNGSAYKIRQAVRMSGSPLCSAAANGSCTFTVTFPKAFLDTSWAGTCTVEASTGTGAVVSIFAGGKTTTTATATFRDFSAATNALTAAACEGWE